MRHFNRRPTRPTDPHPSFASTIGNTDVFNDIQNDGAGSQVVSALWGGTIRTVSQRYGCTNYDQEPRTGAAHGCPQPTYQWWHSGIDIGFGNDTPTLISQWSGTVVTSDFNSGDSDYTILAIQTDAGNIVNIIHGKPLVSVGAHVNIGTPIYQSGNCVAPCAPCGGSSTGPHLHLEIHQAGVICHSSDELNSEGWLFNIPIAGGNQLISPGPGSYLNEFDTRWAVSATLGESTSAPGAIWPSWVNHGAPTSGGQPQVLASNPVAVRQNPNEWDVFATTGNGDLAWWNKMPNCTARWGNPGTGSPGEIILPHPPGQTLGLGIAAVSRKPGTLDVFVTSTNGSKLFHAIGTNSGSCSYNFAWDVDPFSSTPPGFLNTDVAAASANDGNMYVVARDNNNTIWMTHYDNQAWASWLALSALPDSTVPIYGLSAVAWTRSDTNGATLQELFIFLTGANNQVYYGYYATSGWGGWRTYIKQGTSFDSSGKLVAVSWTTFRIDVWVIDRHYSDAGWLWHNAYDPHLYSGWGGWNGQTFYPPPNNMLWSNLSVEAMGYSNIDIVVIATPNRRDFRYYHTSWTSYPSWDALPVS